MSDDIPRERHMSVSHYSANVATPGQNAGRRRSSLIPADAIKGYDNTRNNSVLNARDDTFRKMSVAVPNLAELSQDAKAGADLEKTMGFRESIRLYPMGAFFSFGLSCAVIMEGYDTWLLGSLWTIPAFARKYGTPTGKIKNGVAEYEVSANWQTLFVLGNVTNVLGLLFNGIVSERIGYRKTMIMALVMITCTLFITFFAVNIQMLLVGYILSSFPWGIFQTITTTYASEVTPVSLRPYLTTFVNLSWVIGQLIASGVLKGMVSVNGSLAYRIPFGVQWVWPLPIMLVSYFAPESPW